jgi:soluble lytic murein transglycosylase-like protein
MQNSERFRRRSALLLSCTVGLALTLSACTSVEMTAKDGAAVKQLAATSPKPENSTETTQVATAETAGTEVAATQVAAATGETLPTAVATKGGRVALPPAAEIAAAAAIAAQMQPQAETQVAQVTPAALTATNVAPVTMASPTPAVSATATPNANAAAALPQVIALKGGFPPAPGAPGTPSAAAVPLTEEMMRMQTVVPVPKPQGAMLAYASAPQNAALAAIATREGLTTSPTVAPMVGREKLSGLISKYAVMYNVPEDLVHRVVQRESRYNPSAFNGGHFGLMQIKHATARSMGFDGPASGLFDAETNLKYAVKYLSGAWLVADNNRDNAVRLYARGYYYDAKRKGMLHVLRK